LLDYRGGMSML